MTLQAAACGGSGFESPYPDLLAPPQIPRRRSLARVASGRGIRAWDGGCQFLSGSTRLVGHPIECLAAAYLRVEANISAPAGVAPARIGKTTREDRAWRSSCS